MAQCKFIPWDDNPQMRPMAGPLRFVERTVMQDLSDATDRALGETFAQKVVVKMLQFHSFRHYTKAYHESIEFREQGEWGWWDVPLEKE